MTAQESSAPENQGGKHNASDAVEAFLRRTTRASGVPLQLDDAAAVEQIAAIIGNAPAVNGSSSVTGAA